MNDPQERRRAINLASAFAFAGNRPQAMRHLEKAADERDPRIYWARAFPQYWFLWGDPRFNAVLDRLGLPPTLAQ